MAHDAISRAHITRLRMATTNRLRRKDLALWIERNTFINGKPFSFLNHEYQHRILQDESSELVIRKSAQTGISEMSMRMALGLLMIMPGAFRIGYTFPTATFAQSYSKSRLNPIINSSPALRAAIKADDIDNSEVKTFGTGKELYFKGAAIGNAAISTTLDMLFHDELSFSDMDVIGDYWSRVLHSSYKWTVKLSTPTFTGDPIDTAFQHSRRHWNLCKCNHCNHWFTPNYYEHVVIPDFGHGEVLNSISKSNLHTTRYKEAWLACPSCGDEVSLAPEHREWVCENPTDNFNAAGYQVQPFDAPQIVTLPDLVDASTKYASKSKFKQFSLGMPATDSESGLTPEDIDAIAVEGDVSRLGAYVMGIDMGDFSHFMVGGIAQDGTLVVAHYERVPLKDFRARYAQLSQQFRVQVKVCDIQPNTELVMSLCAVDSGLFGARYVTRSGLEVFDVRRQDEDRFNALEGLREVSVNRNALFDKLLAEIRPVDGEKVKIRIRKSNDWELLKTHLCAMRRATATVRNGEFTSLWQKPANGQDHYHHALGYLWVAAQMRGIALTSSLVSMGVSKFKVRDPAHLRRPAATL